MQSLNNNKYYKYFWILLGLFLVLYYIWFRFIRERLPRDIPFKLNLINFISLCFICFIYIVVIRQIYKKQITSNIILNNIFLKINLIFKPLIKYHLDLFSKNNIDYYFTKKLGFIIKKYKLYNDKINLRIILILDIIPKMIVLLSFIFDVFYFKNLNYFYYFVIIGLIPLIFTYFLYLSKNFLENVINNLHNNYYVKLLSTEENTSHLDFFVPIYCLKFNDYQLLDTKYFIDIQAKNLLYDYDLYEYSCVETLENRKTHEKTCGIPITGWFILEPKFDNISDFFSNMEGALFLHSFLESYKDFNKPFVMQKYLLLILFTYLFCWIYILIISCSLQNILSLIELIILVQPPRIDDVIL